MIPGARFPLLASTIAALLPLSVHAQEKLEEIIVTAQKKAQDVLTVPMAIGVVTGDQVAAYGATDLSQIQATVPGLTMVDIGSGFDTIIIRGISPIGSTLPAVGEFVDDVSMSGELNGYGFKLPLVDLARVEVLKGPQGTLYGEGSIGGTIKYFTNTPSLDGATHGSAELEASTVDGGNQGWRASLAGDLPISSEKFGVRLAGFYEDAPGWVDNEFKGDDSNGHERWLLRGRVRAKPTDTLTLDFSYQHFESKRDATDYSLPDYTSHYYTNRPNTEKSDIYALNAAWQIGNATLTSVTGYQDRKIEAALDVSVYALFVETFFPGTTIYAPLFGHPFTTANPISHIAYNVDQPIKTFTEELRLVGSINDRLQYTTGLFYKDSSYKASLSTPTYPDPNVIPIEIVGGELNSGTKSYAVFGELTWALTDHIEATGGLRYYRDKRNTDQSAITFGVPASIEGTLNNDATVPRFVLKYKFNDDTMVYASAGQGFRSGGFQLFNTEPYGISNTYDPETLTSYELGTKSALLDRRLTLEGAVFYSKWKDVQVFAANPLGLQAFANEGEAEIKGFEASGAWQATDNLQLQASFGYNDTKYNTGGVTHDPGDPMDYVPKKTWSASADYRVPLWGDTKGHLRLDYQHMDERPYIVRNFGYPNPVTYFDPVDNINARVGIELGRWTAELFVENIANDDAEVVKPVSTLPEGIIQKPRTIGLTMRTSF